MHSKFIITSLLISAITLALTACAGSSSSSSTQPPQETEEIAVTSSVSQEVARRTQNGGRIVIIITGPDGYRREEPATLDANNKINLAVTVPRLATGAYRITIELRDRMGSIIAAASQDATAGSPTALNVTNPIFGIPQRGQMTLIWDNKIDAPSFLIRWESIDAGPKNRQIEGAAKNTTSQYIIRNLTDASFYTFTVYAKHIQGVINLATYQFAGSPGPNNDNDTQNDLVDPDDDNDGVRDRTPDNCPFTYNPVQRNIDNDGRGDACDTDDDNDGIPDTTDNCPTAPNPSQANAITPENPLGDACDDRDNDGLVDADDPCPTITEPCFYINNITDLHAIPDNAAAIYYLNTSLTNADRPAINNFTGIFYGRGNTISGLANPLFHTIARDARVTNIGILGSTLAIRNAGAITRAYATGNSSDHAISDPRVFDGAEIYHSGGLVALNLGRINASYATGNATCPTTPRNGECYSGGLVGWSLGTITNAYATGDSSTTGLRTCSSGGLVGWNQGTIRNAYTTGESTVSRGGHCTRVGGLVGTNHISGNIIASYRVQSSGTDGGVGDTPQTLAELRSATSYTDWSNAIWNFGTANDLPTLRSLDRDSDGDGIYDISDNCPLIANPHQYNNDSDRNGDACDPDDDNDGVNDYNADGTTLDNCPTVPNKDQADLDGDRLGDACDNDIDGDTHSNEEDPCPTDPHRDCQGIATVEDLNRLLNGTISDDGYYRLTDNITISAGAGWTPISDFRGTLNGDNHTITFGNGTLPLFDLINATATVTHIGIINSTLAYRNHGNISYAYATGNSRCTGNYCGSGGLVGINDGTISHSYATGNSTCRYTCGSGGLVGINDGTISHSYATGNSTCTGFYCGSGGLVGWNDDGTISRSYATGNSTCIDLCGSGGLVGYNIRGIIRDSYATGDHACTHSHDCSGGGLVGINSGSIIRAYASGDSSGGGYYGGFPHYSGYGRYGGLVGHNNDGGIINASYATGETNGNLAGGLVGRNAGGTISHSYATGNSNGANSGGLVGWNRPDDRDKNGIIRNSYATGNTNGTYSSGGLVAYNDAGIIRNSYATGNGQCTKSNCRSGGLVGFYYRGTIASSYATGNSRCLGSNCGSGGLVGSYYRGTITASYRVQRSGTDGGDGDMPRTLAQLRCPTVPGEFCQDNTTYSEWNATLWDFGTPSLLPTLRNLPSCPIDNPACRHRITDTDNDRVADAEDNCLTFTNADQANLDGDRLGDACDNDIDGDGRNNTDDAFPRDATEYRDSDNDRIGDNSDNCRNIANGDQADRDGDDYGDVCDAFPRDATEQTDTDNDGIGDRADNCPTDPNLDCQGIATDEDLILLLNGTISDDGYYRLTDNITISAGAGWTPISDFRGTLNGNNHTITFRIGTQPLFDRINATATVTQIGIINSTLAHRNDGNISYAYATGNSACTGTYCYSGGLVDMNTGIITASYATGNSSCDGERCDSGGLVGWNNGIITASYATGNSTGAYSGGLVGYNFGAITASYATGNSNDGGLVGFNHGGNITASYATGNSNGGGLVGSNWGTITASYATGNSICTYENCASGGLVRYNGYGTGTGITASYATGNSTCTGSQCRSGGLVGWNLGNITASYATGNSACSGSQCRSGGLVGHNRGFITASYATGNSNGRNSGGLVGLNWGFITASYATGNSNSSNGNSGGLVGQFNSGTITASYATGNSACSGSQCRSGGLVGINFGTLTINNSYATGNSRCTGENCDSGGLVGWNDGLITASYATGNSRCTGDSCDSGGLVGDNSEDDTITASYRVQSSGTDGGDGDTPQTLAQLREAPSYSGWMTPPWDFGTTTELPRHHRDTGIPFCPGATDYSDTSCRW